RRSHYGHASNSASYSGRLFSSSAASGDCRGALLRRPWVLSAVLAFSPPPPSPSPRPACQLGDLLRSLARTSQRRTAERFAWANRPSTQRYSPLAVEGVDC